MNSKVGNRMLVIAICTRNRPNLLAVCLSSVAALRSPPQTRLQVVVVDNSEAEEMQLINRQATESALNGMAFTVLNEKRLGIPFARNRAVDFAADSGADALIFLDDDQAVPPDWLEVMVQVWREEAADAVKSSVRWKFEGAGRYRNFFEAQEPDTGSDGRLRNLAELATNGVLIDRKIFAEWGLRFDTAYGFIGCDDADYFVRSQARGGRHVLTSETHATEFCPASKQTLRWLLRREFRVGTGMAAIALKNGDRGSLLTKGARRAVRYGIAAILFSPAPSLALRFLLRASRGSGLCWGSLGNTVSEYRKVVGS